MRIKKATPSDQLNESPLESDKAPDKAKSSGESTKKRASAPYKHGKGFAIRRQYCGHAIFLSGFKTKTAAEQAIAQEMAAIDSGKLPLGRGPDNTILAQALQDYARERLPFLKGAEQEARRINRYLRAADLDLLKVTEIPPQTGQDIKTGRGSFYKVELVEHIAKRTIPQSLTRHRKALLNANADTHTYRARMAALPMTEISHTLMQEFIDVMQSEHNAPSTIALERALLRSLFNHAFRKWNWYALCDNPATKLRMPKVDNERDRVLTVEEQQRLEQALATCRNRAVLPTITLLCETAMRVSEPRKRAVWGDVDWNRSVLHLNDAKAGRRGVPLSPAAIKALNTLKAMGGGKDNGSTATVSDMTSWAFALCRRWCSGWRARRKFTWTTKPGRNCATSAKQPKRWRHRSGGGHLRWRLSQRPCDDRVIQRAGLVPALSFGAHARQT